MKAIVNFVLGVVMFVLVVIWIIALLVFNSKWLDKKTLTLKEFKIFFIDCIKENYL